MLNDKIKIDIKVEESGGRREMNGEGRTLKNIEKKHAVAFQCQMKKIIEI
jgi:hypothetical protein